MALFRQPEEIDIMCLYLDEKLWLSFKHGEDFIVFIKELGQIGKYKIEMGPTLPYDEYELTWC